MLEREHKTGYVGLALLAGTAGLTRFLGEIIGGVVVFLVERRAMPSEWDE